MKPSIALNAHRAEIRLIVEANRAVNARVFGSVLHGRILKRVIWTSWLTRNQG
jgi:hypothetical protein